MKGERKEDQGEGCRGDGGERARGWVGEEGKVAERAEEKNKERRMKN